MSKRFSSERKYELVVIFNPDLDEAGLENETARVKQLVAENTGTVERVDNWGRRQLAYEIEKKSYGYYFLFVVVGSNEMNAEVDRALRISDNVLRHMIVHKDKDAPDFIPDVRDSAREAAREAAQPRGERSFDGPAGGGRRGQSAGGY
ncbi:MAG: 30S ribosomal protein S6 [bacterium]|nr:30S ribosomal protein S6 [bacterium]